MRLAQRPSLVEKRTRSGEWEGDTIIGRRPRQALVSLTESKAGRALFYTVDQHTQEATAITLKWLRSPLAEEGPIITADSGQVFSAQASLAKELKGDVYFAPA